MLTSAFEFDLQAETAVVQKVVPGCPDIDQLMKFVHSLRGSSDPAMTSIASSLSTRQIIRIAKRLSKFPSKDLHRIIQKACLANFLPSLPKIGLEQALEAADIWGKKKVDDETDRSISCEVKDGKVRIGETMVPVYNPENKTKVPDVLFYENPMHLSVMEDMLKDFDLGEHLLLVGNQGVGKNKIVDRFLHLLNRSREYIQLHRDTTVQTLTLQPVVKGGVIVFEDSPLVRAVKQGHVLVVDEADKAPTHVTCILKTLIETGEMHLADGRRIVSEKSGIKPSPNVIIGHPDFRMIVLANRPGFPFLGNDFFGAMGDIFSCHAILNPDMHSEMSMLRRYGPNVPESVLEKLVQAFGELRNMADQGLIAYPYSTREVVNIVRHLEKFPEDGLRTVVRNVFDFDAYSKELQETIVQTMQRHGIPFGAMKAEVNLAIQLPLPKFNMVGSWTIAGMGNRQKTATLSLPSETAKITLKGPIEIAVQNQALERMTARATSFTEQEAFWNIPLSETNIISDVCVSKATNSSSMDTDIIHVATANPISVYSVNPKLSTCTMVDLYDLFPNIHSYRPKVRMAALGEPMENFLLLHEEMTNSLVYVNYVTGEVTRVVSPALPSVPLEKRRFPSAVQQRNQNPYRMCPSSLPNSKGTMLFYELGGENVIALDGMFTQAMTVPLRVKDAHQVGDNQWMLSDFETNKKYFLHLIGEDEFSLQPVKEGNNQKEIMKFSPVPLSDPVLSKCLNAETSAPNRQMVTTDSYATILVGFPGESDVQVHSAPREPLPEEENASYVTRGTSQILNMFGSSSPASEPAKAIPEVKRSQIVHLPLSGQIVQALSTWKVAESLLPEKKHQSGISGYLEVVDPANHNLRYIPVPAASRYSPYTSWLNSMSDTNVFIAPTSNDGLVTVDTGGCIRYCELFHIDIVVSTHMDHFVLCIPKDFFNI